MPLHAAEGEIAGPHQIVVEVDCWYRQIPSMAVYASVPRNGALYDLTLLRTAIVCYICRLSIGYSQASRRALEITVIACIAEPTRICKRRASHLKNRETWPAICGHQHRSWHHARRDAGKADEIVYAVSHNMPHPYVQHRRCACSVAATVGGNRVCRAEELSQAFSMLFSSMTHTMGKDAHPWAGSRGFPWLFFKFGCYRIGCIANRPVVQQLGCRPLVL